MVKISNGLKPDYSIDITTVTLDGTGAYSESVINYAKRLKAANPGYADYFYLDYAKQHLKEEMLLQQKVRHANKIAQSGIPDEEWAKYTYEDIISMYDSGIYVPTEVLAWAYSMQETDITSYVIVSDDVSSFDSDFRTEASSDTGVKDLQLVTRKYIVLAQKTMESLQSENEKFQITLNRAQDIKQEQENSYQKTLEEYNSKINEFKNLKNKKEQGLTPQEEKRYKEMGNDLKEKSSEIIDIQNDEKDLKDFVQSYISLSQNTQAALDIARETLNKADSLSRFDNSLGLQKNYSKVSVNTSSLNLPTNESLPYSAYSAASDLQNTADSINAGLADTRITETADFAQNYIDQTGNLKDFDTNSLNLSDTTLPQNESSEQENNTNIAQEAANSQKQSKTGNTDNNKTSETDNPPENNIQDKPQKTADTTNNRRTTRNSERRNPARAALFRQNATKQLENIQTRQEVIEASLQTETSRRIVQNNAQPASENTEFKNTNAKIQNAINEIKQTVSSAASITEPKEIQPVRSAAEEGENASTASADIQENPNLNKPQKTSSNITTRNENNAELSRISQSREEIRVSGNKRVKDVEIFNIKPALQNTAAEPEDNVPQEEDNNENNSETTLRTSYTGNQRRSERNNSANVTPETENTDKEETNGREVYIEGFENKSIMPENITLNNLSQAASAAVYSNSGKETPTTDKEEKRLTRFNNDSIIKSRKKKKKVTEISGAQSGSVNS